MEEQNTRNEMLELMDQPAFLVKNGMIIHCNQPARQLLIEPNSPLCPLLGDSAEEYEQFQGGCLYLTLSICGGFIGASVNRIDDFDIFMLEPEGDRPELRAMALAARDFREPLAGVLTIADRLLPALEKDASPEMKVQLAQMNQRLFQMLRLVGNMSDVSRYQNDNGSHHICQDVCSVLEEIFERAAELTAASGITLRFTAPREPIHSMIDEEKLERAIYNILSNSMKFTPAGGTIHAELTRHGNKLHLSIQDSGSGISGDALRNVYHRYQRQPTFEEGRNGIGLGMALVQATASAHGGAVLITHPQEGGTRVTMTLSIRQAKNTTMRSPIMRIDYAGERDHGLLELSGNLPFELYKPEG